MRASELAERGGSAHAVREYLAALDAPERCGARRRRWFAATGANREPPESPLTDPQSTWVARPGIDAFFAYDANYLIDDKAGIIIDAEAPAPTAVVEIAHADHDRAHRRRFGLRPGGSQATPLMAAFRLLQVAGGSQHARRTFR